MNQSLLTENDRLKRANFSIQKISEPFLSAPNIGILMKPLSEFFYCIYVESYVQKSHPYPRSKSE